MSLVTIDQRHFCADADSFRIRYPGVTVSPSGCVTLPARHDLPVPTM